jgi:hypothetical protein
MRCNISLRAIKTWLYTHLTEKQHLTDGSRLVLLVTTLTALTFASIFTLQTTTNEISKPSIEIYEELLTHHSDTLQCPCVQSSIPYKLFMNVTVSNRHQVCSSPFITKEWIETLLLSEPQSSHSPIDFRKTAISFFQLLASLCQLTKQHLNDELSDLLSRSLINTNAISRVQLNEQIHSLISQFQLNTPLSFLTTLQLIRAMTSDNLLIPVFETNWQWMDPSLNHPEYWGVKLNTKPIVYNESCNCGLSSQCFQESSTMPGLLVGCYPLESLLKSTLQCLYNASCFSQLPTVKRSFIPLIDSKTSRYEKNSTVELILNQLMVEQWFNSVTYENYYNQCAPSLCSYSYTQRRSALEVLTLLLGLEGGLTIIMNILARIVVAVWQKFFIIQLRRNAQVQPM